MILNLFVLFCPLHFPQEIDCGVLPTPDKAEKILETHTKVNGVVRFKCKETGYEINGSEIRSCGNNGLWSGSPTSCNSKYGMYLYINEFSFPLSAFTMRPYSG